MRAVMGSILLFVFLFPLYGSSEPEEFERPLGSFVTQSIAVQSDTAGNYHLRLPNALQEVTDDQHGIVYRYLLDNNETLGYFFYNKVEQVSLLMSELGDLKRVVLQPDQGFEELESLSVQCASPVSLTGHFPHNLQIKAPHVHFLNDLQTQRLEIDSDVFSNQSLLQAARAYIRSSQITNSHNHTIRVKEFAATGFNEFTSFGDLLVEQLLNIKGDSFQSMGRLFAGNFIGQLDQCTLKGTLFLPRLFQLNSLVVNLEKGLTIHAYDLLIKSMDFTANEQVEVFAKHAVVMEGENILSQGRLEVNPVLSHIQFPYYEYFLTQRDKFRTRKDIQSQYARRTLPQIHESIQHLKDSGLPGIHLKSHNTLDLSGHLINQHMDTYLEAANLHLSAHLDSRNLFVKAKKAILESLTGRVKGLHLMGDDVGMQAQDLTAHVLTWLGSFFQLSGQMSVEETLQLGDEEHNQSEISLDGEITTKDLLIHSQKTHIGALTVTDRANIQARSSVLFSGTSHFRKLGLETDLLITSGGSHIQVRKGSFEAQRGYIAGRISGHKLDFEIPIFVLQSGGNISANTLHMENDRFTSLANSYIQTNYGSFKARHGEIAGRISGEHLDFEIPIFSIQSSGHILGDDLKIKAMDLFDNRGSIHFNQSAFTRLGHEYHFNDFTGDGWLRLHADAYQDLKGLLYNTYHDTPDVSGLFVNAPNERVRFDQRTRASRSFGLEVDQITMTAPLQMDGDLILKSRQDLLIRGVRPKASGLMHLESERDVVFQSKGKKKIKRAGANAQKISVKSGRDIKAKAARLIGRDGIQLEAERDIITDPITYNTKRTWVTRGGAFGHKKKRWFKIKPHVKRTCVLSKDGKVKVKANNRLRSTATDYIGGKGVTVYSKKSPILKDVIAKKRSGVDVSGVFRKESSRLYKTVSHANFMLNKSKQHNITLVTEDAIKSKGLDILSLGGLVIKAPKGVDIKSRRLNHHYRTERSGLQVDSSVLTIPQLLTGKKKVSCLIPGLSHLKRLAQSKHTAEIAASALSSYTHVLQELSLLGNSGSLRNYGLSKLGLRDPSVSFGYGRSKTTRSWQTRSPTSIFVGTNLEIDTDNADIRFGNGIPIHVIGDAKLRGRRLIQEDFSGKSYYSHQESSQGFKGSTKHVGVQTNRNKRTRIGTQRQVQLFDIRGTLDVGHLQEWSLLGAQTSAGQLTGLVDHLNIISHQDEWSERHSNISGSLNTDLTGSLSCQQGSERGRVTTARSFIHVGSDLNSDENSFEVGTLYMEGGDITGQGVNHLKVGRVIARDVHDIISGHHFGGGISTEGCFDTLSFGHGSRNYHRVHRNGIYGIQGTNLDIGETQGRFVTSRQEMSELLRDDSLNIELETVAPWEIKRAHQQAKQGWNILRELFDTPDIPTPYSVPETLFEEDDFTQEHTLEESLTNAEDHSTIVDDFVQLISLGDLWQRDDDDDLNQDLTLEEPATNSEDPFTIVEDYQSQPIDLSVEELQQQYNDFSHTSQIVQEYSQELLWSHYNAYNSPYETLTDSEFFTLQSLAGHINLAQEYSELSEYYNGILEHSRSNSLYGYIGPYLDEVHQRIKSVPSEVWIDIGGDVVGLLADRIPGGGKAVAFLRPCIKPLTKLGVTIVKAKPLLGKNPRITKSRTLTDLDPVHDRATARSIFRNQTKGQKAEEIRKDDGTIVRIADNGVRLRMNPDGTTRVDLPGRGTQRKGETIHFNHKN